MNPEDEKRLERERSLWEAKQGPNYSRLNQSIRAEKRATDRQDNAAYVTWLREYAGYQKAVRDKLIEPYPGGFRKPPRRRSKGRDDGRER